MQLKPPGSRADFELIAGWLARKENYQWLDFADGHHRPSLEWLKISVARGTDAMRLFTADGGSEPIGVVGLTGINPHFKTAKVWVVLGDKTYARLGYASRAASKMLTLGFCKLGLRSINTWVVDHNTSVGVARKIGFRPIGRQRQCHCIDGRSYDRLWFDVLASEHVEIDDEYERIA